jgi:hypothetical protein
VESGIAGAATSIKDRVGDPVGDIDERLLRLADAKPPRMASSHKLIDGGMFARQDKGPVIDDSDSLRWSRLS